MLGRRKNTRERLAGVIEDAGESLQGRLESQVQTWPAGRERRRGPRDWLYDALELPVRLFDKLTAVARLGLLLAIVPVLAGLLAGGRRTRRSERTRPPTE